MRLVGTIFQKEGVVKIIVNCWAGRENISALFCIRGYV